MSWESWALFCVTEAVLCVTPGPAVLMVVSTALSRGSRNGLQASLGILAANTGYFVLSATSLGTMLLASWELFSLVKWAGAAYLLWLAAGMIAGSLRHRPEMPPEPAVRPSRQSASFVQGFLTQAANPKALLFFSAILPQFVDPTGPIARQIVILGVSSVVIELAVLAAYVGACRSAEAWTGRTRLAAPLQAAGGVLLAAAAARLAFMKVA
ncbi:MAG: LysE family translocator [Candidatus Polarisedimenticolia bacterium]